MSDTVDFDQTVTAKRDSFEGNPGYVLPQHAATEFGGDAFVINALLGRLATTALVRVVAVTNSGGLSPVGFVDVQPLVNQVDSQGNPTPHGVIHNLPYMRLQGGVNAVIVDPAVNDKGVAMFCSRDISTVKRTKAAANPGSARQFDWADGLYVGGFLNGVPTNYVSVNNGTIAVVSPNSITLTAPNVTVNASGTFTVNGNVATTGTLTNNTHAVGSTHEHTASGGTGIGGPPV